MGVRTKQGRPLAGTPRRIALVVVGALFALAFAASSATAVKVHPLLTEVTLPTPPPGGIAPFSVAINQTTHHVYISQGRRVVSNFTAEGKLDPTHPRLTGVSGAEPYGIAVDNSGSATNGFVYTTELSGSVHQYDADGAATPVDITVASIPANGTAQAGGLPPVVNDGHFTPKIVAVDSSGNVFVPDDAHPNLIDEFTPAGSFVAQYPYGAKATGVGSLAIGPAGQFYFLSGGDLYRLASDGSCLDGSHLEGAEEKCNPFVTPEGSAKFVSLSATASGKFLLARRDSLVAIAIVEYDSTGTLVSAIGGESIFEAEPGAVLDEGSDQVYAVDTRSRSGEFGVGRLLVFGSTVILPDAKTLPPSAVTDRSAVFHGEIGADGGLASTCVFQYVDSEEFEATKFASAREVACIGGPFTNEALSPVESAVAGGLSGGTTYHVRLLATNGSGSNPGTAVTFRTKGPTITSTKASEISETTATLRGLINPNGSTTSYHFEYLTLNEYEANDPEDRFAGAKEVPSGGGQIGNGEAPIAVSQPIGELAIGTEYRFRIVASGADGENAGGTQGPVAGFATFVPPPPGFPPCPNDARREGASKSLPDCRAYEQASPVDKNGASISGETDAVQAALDGSGITFFSGLGIAGGEGAQNFPSYLASRASDGSAWSTRGLLPPASTGPYGVILGWSSDLQRVYSENKQTGSPPLFYMRQGSAPLNVLAEGGGEARGQFSFAAQSSSGSEVLFENHTSALVPAAVPGKTNAYVWDEETGKVHLAGVLNNGTAPSGGSFAGSYDWFGRHDTETGAAEAHYYLQGAHAVSEDGSRIFFTAAGTGQLYMRENPLAPQSPVDGEGKCTTPGLACTVQISESQRSIPESGEKPAAFLTATPDGSQIYFLSRAKLTDDATGGPESTGGDLYRYEANGELVDLTPDVSDEGGADVQGMLGMSQDGSYIYFAANGVLASGAEPGNCSIGVQVGECNIYVAHEGTIRFIARLQAEGAGVSDLLNWQPTSSNRNNGNLSLENSARVTPDGSTLLFRSQARLTFYDNEGRAELYRYDFGGGILCISCNPTGESPTGDATLQGLPNRLLGPRLSYAVETRNMSPDGGRIFFDTPDRLVSNDANKVSDVYEWEAKGVGSCDSEAQNGGCLYLISTGSATAEPSYFGDADEKGENAFFFTASRLVAQDKDALVDVYDARVDGGIAAQETEPRRPCLNEDCLGPVSGAPPITIPKSPGANGTNVAPPKPCKKGQVRRHNKCVKKKQKKHKHHKKKHKHHKKTGHGKGKKSGKGGNR